MAKKSLVKKKTPSVNKSCFVIMPFGDWFDEYYEKIYCPAIKSAGLVPQRSDDLYRSSNIVQDIWNYTQRAEVLLAELTGKNPNVFYELGLAHASGKPAILITQSIEDVPFDLRSLRVIEYDKNAPDWGDALKANIKNAIEETLASPEEAIPPTFLGVRRDSQIKVTKSQKEYLELKSRVESIERQVEHSSLRSSNSTHHPIPPSEAKERIKRYFDMGMPENLIIDRLRRQGVPRSWVESRIEELKSKTENDSSIDK